MKKRLTQAEIDAIFANMNLPMIERGIEEIRNAKERFISPEVVFKEPALIMRLILSGGTGPETGTDRGE